MIDHGISLYDHNREAYDKLCILLGRYKKACVIHPTGTGKSLIAFKFIEDNPGMKVIWLSPSNHIFAMQAVVLDEMLDKNSSRAIFDRIRCYTYTHIMSAKEDLEDYKADIIILDEFHRCGAPMWYGGVHRLIENNKEAMIIGLTATNIRYLDSRRDMAEDLFDSIIASKMTLPEAIAMRILPAPRYIISLYAYDYTELEEVGIRVSREKNEIKKKYLESLLMKIRRSTANASGLNRVFEKHLVGNGKYIVFCNCRDQFKEIEGRKEEWFGRIDPEPVIYKVSCEMRDVTRTIERFEHDRSEHLKLLLCIDLLNEGVHINDIDGVILLRPTSSPTLYLQQIGRALSTGCGKQPVIFDIVNNYSSLKTFDALYRDTKLLETKNQKHSNIVSNFDIIDEMADSRKLFKELQDNLDENWDSYYLEAKRYYEKTGDLDVDTSYVTESGLSLGLWLRTQKRIKAGLIRGKLSRQKQELLELIGIDWSKDIIRHKKSWDKGYRVARDYYNKNGCLVYERDHDSSIDSKMIFWLQEQRRNRALLSEEQKRLLDRIGMEWKHRSNADMDCWYIIHTQDGREEIIIDRIKSRLDKSLYNDIWIANRYEIRKKEGKEYMLKTRMYPGYIFVNTDNIGKIQEFLYQNHECKGLLKTGGLYSRIEGANRILVDFLAGEAGQIGISKGIIVNGKTKVEVGPLVGMEEYICKIDRHKRKAWLDFGDGNRVIFPLEITEKIEEI